jgi:hypothetical protein
MALIYSYPLVSNADIDSSDLILMSESSADSETKNISIGQLSSYMIEAGAAGSSQILDYRNLLSSYMSVEGGILVLDGFYNKSEVAGLISGKADSSVTAALAGRITSIESTTIPPISSAINNHLTAYSTYTGITDGRLLQLEANIDSVNGAMYQMHLGTQGYLQQAKTYTNEQLGDYSTTSISQQYTDTVTEDLATNTFVQNMGSSFGSVDPTTGVVTVNEAFANTIITTSSSPRFATSIRTEEIGVTAGTAKAGVTTNSQAIGGIDGRVKAMYSLEVVAGNNVAGMKLGADNESSYVSFLADRFKIYNGSTAESPFEVIGGAVKIKDGVIGNISLGQVTGAADAFQQVTTVYAEDANGTNPSTTRGTRGFVAWYTNINLWTPSAGVSELEFERIQGDQGIQGIPGNPGAPGSPGTPGIPGPAGSSVTIKGTVASVNDLPSATSTIGDGYIVGNDLHVFVGGTTWNNVGVVRGPIGLQGDPGEDGVGTDGIDGNNGDYVSYVYKVSNNAPAAPSSSSGSFNGTVETVPTGGWTDNPSADINDTEWMSTRRYSHNAATGNWTPGNWSTPTRIYQRGIAGNTPVKNIDYFDGKEGAFVSFIFKVSATAPAAPVGGSFNGTGETFPSNWYDEPTANVDDTEWMSKRKYTNTKTYDSNGNETSTWSGGSWSTPVRIYQKGDTGGVGPRGNPGIAIDGDNVRIEYATSANGPWSSVQQASSTYIRSAVQANGTGAYVGGAGTKFVPTLGVEYDNGQPGINSYIHIKYSDNGTSFSGSNGETIGEWRGIYVDSTEADSNTFSDYKWIKTTGATGNTGANGLKTKTGLLWYSANSGTNPGQPSATSYNFTNNTITGLSSGWSLSPPIMRPGTASNLYWTSTYNVTEQASPANTGTITFEPTTQAFGFDQVVTFNSLSTNSSTVINGENITTGIIQSSNYVEPGAGNAQNEGFAAQGMGIDLNDGSIHAEQFYVNSDGAAGFGGSIKLVSAETTTRGAQTIELKPDYGKISIGHASKQVPYTWNNQQYSYSTSSGILDLDSEGVFLANEGQNCYSGTTGNDSKASIISLMQGNSYTPTVISPQPAKGERFVTGIYAKATNSVGSIGQDYLHEPLGAVIEDLRADGFVQRLYNLPAPQPNDAAIFQLPDKYVLYILSDSRTQFYLPANPKTGQTVKIIRTGGGKKNIYANYTAYPASNSNKIWFLNNSGFSSNTFVEVTYCEEFIWTGVYWLQNRMD